MFNAKKIAFLLLIPAIFTSCLRHHFIFNISEDGMLDYVYEAAGDSLDMHDGFIALPSGFPWDIEEYVEIDSSGETFDTVFHYRAKTSFSEDSAIPASFGLEHVEIASLTMKHPLEFKRQDLFFMINYLFELRFDNRNKTGLYADPNSFIPEECKELENADSLSSERRELLETLEEAGYREWYVNLLQDRFSKSLLHTLNMHPEISYDADKIESAEASLEEFLIDMLNREYLSDFDSDTEMWNFIFHPGYDVLEEELNFIGDTTFFVDMRTTGELLTKEYNATEDLSDDTFLIELRLPGTLKSSNADSLAAGGSLIWQFNGDDIADSSIVMYAVSVIYYPARLYIAGGIFLFILIIIAVKIIRPRASDA